MAQTLTQVQQLIYSLATRVDRLQRSVCCSNSISNVSTQDSSTITFSGLGTPDDPLTADVIPGAGSSIVTQNSATVTFFGDGSPDNPLTAEASGDVPTPTLSAVLSAGNIVSYGQTIDFYGGSPTSGNLVGRIKGGPTGSSGNYLDIGSPYYVRFTSSVRTSQTLELEGTFESFVLSGGSTQITWRNGATLQGRMGFVSNGTGGIKLNIDANSNALELNGILGTALTPGTNTVIASTDTWIQALAKLQAQITALQTP